jgi:hypothetical protein
VSISTFTRLRTSICVTVLLAVVAALLPAQRASAEEQRYVIDRDEVNRLIYQTYLLHPGPNAGGPLEIEDIIFTGLILSLPKDRLGDAGKSLGQLEDLYHNLLGPDGAKDEYRASLPISTVVQTIFDAALKTPAFRDVAETVYRDLRAEASNPLFDNFTATGKALLKTIEEETVLSVAYRYWDETFGNAWERAKADPFFARAWNSIAPDSSVTVENFDAKTYLANHPDAAPPRVSAAIGPDGSMEISLADLQQLATTEFGKINASIDDLQLTLGTLSAQQGQLVDFMRNQQARQQAQALAEAKAKEHKLKLEAANSAVSIIATLAGVIDPKLGKQIATVGSSAIKIGESLNGWMHAVAGLNGLNKLTSLSTVVMTGNVLGAVMNVVSLFGKGQPTPDKLILAEIGKLRQQVSELRTEMHTRFDQIDKELATIYTTMQQRFDQIDVQLGRINGSLEEIQQSLLTLSLALNRLERNNFEYLDAIGRRPLLTAINGALGYKQRTGLDMPYQPDFVEYENTFQSWGTINAFDALSAGPSQRDFSDGQVLAELSAAPLDANVNYLNGWLSAHGLPPFASKRLAGLRDWAFASRAYADMGLDWPAHLQRINPQRQAALDAVGNDLQLALHNISTIQTPSGLRGNTLLFTGVISYYTAKLEALDSALAASDAAFVTGVQSDLGREVPFDLFGGFDQPLAYQAPGISTMSCGDTTGNAPAAPSTLKAQTPNFNRYNLAEYLKLGTITSCLSATLTNVKLICPPGKDVCDRQGDLRIFVDARFNNVSLEARTLAAGRVIVPGEMDLTNYVIGRWGALKATFEAQSTSVTPTPALAQQRAELLSTTTMGVQNRLRDYQHLHYSQVLSELNSGSLHALAVELAGAKKLLDSFVTLGLPQALDRDDFLRSLLFSDQALVDDRQCVSAYATHLAQTGGATQAISETQLMTNPRIELREVGQKRREALSSLLASYLDAISAGSYSENSSMIANARSDLQFARLFASSDQPLPTRRIFLPLVRR